jgi:hypothetical protein
MRYQINHENGRSNLAFVTDSGSLHVIDSDNPTYSDILDAVLEGDECSAVDLMDAAKAANDKFQKVTDRVAVSGAGVVTFDGDVVDNSLADAIVRAMREGADFTNLVLFMENIYQNPRKHSRDNLFDWLRTHAFTITHGGLLVGYKGVSETLGSISRGPGIVNGQPQNGSLDNSVGNVLEMARSSVEHDPARGCSVGLHVGTWEYASSFGPKVVKVLVNPRDVVSVPTDCDWQKMRVCRYKVADVLDSPVDTFMDPAWDNDWDESNW